MVKKSVKANEYIILRLPSNPENILFVYQTFGISQYIFYDDRFPTKQLKEKYSKHFDKQYYNELREKCLEISNNEISFTINEFTFLSKLIDFVSKSFIGEPNSKLKKVISEDFKDDQNFDYDKSRKAYLHTASSFFMNFKECCKNEALLKEIYNTLNWEIEI